MTTTRLFQSTDASAPVLTGQVGSLIALLQACLVGTAGVAYGSGGTAKTAAGWTNPYDDATNHKTAFRNSLAIGGSGCYLRIDDSGGGTGGAREALIRGYLTMSDVNTGTDPTPTTVQMAAGFVVRKSSTLTSAARAWIVLADELSVYIYTHDGSVNFPYSVAGAGDYQCDVPGMAAPFFVSGRAVGTAATDPGGGLSMVCASIVGVPGIYLSRGASGLTGPVLATQPMLFPPLAGYPVGGNNASMARPSPGGSNEYFQPTILQANATIMGHLRGVYLPYNKFDGVAAGTTRAAAVGLSSASVLVLLRHWSSSSVANDGHLAIESALAWS